MTQDERLTTILSHLIEAAVSAGCAAEVAEAHFDSLSCWLDELPAGRAGEVLREIAAMAGGL